MKDKQHDRSRMASSTTRNASSEPSESNRDATQQMRAQTQADETEHSLCPSRGTQHRSEEAGSVCRLLFQKKLGQSDVDNRRLVIPNPYATKFLPQIEEVAGHGTVATAATGRPIENINTELTFYDRTKSTWKFRCYKDTSGSFLFTKGWSRFVKDKGLNPKDIVSFYMCEDKGDNAGNAKKYCMIDVNKDESNVMQGQGVEQPGLTPIADQSDGEEDEIHEENKPTEEEETDSNRKRVKRFGTDISSRTKGIPFLPPPPLLQV